VCGICGLVNADRTRHADVIAVSRMNEAMVHRGPDDAGVWHERHVALAMRRLSILDLPGGHQPMTNEDGSLAVVFNGEIYNYQEIRKDLVARGHRFATNSDTEVLVHGYETYGDGLLDRLNGMFAFAAYDVARDRLLVARDRLGIKPLFYCHRGGQLVFASELDALVRSGLVPARVKAAAVDAYFAFLYVPAPDTIYEDVYKLRPGEKLVFQGGELAVERYWQPVFQPDSHWAMDSAADEFVRLFEDAVRLQRISDVPLGAFLSGGMDSSAVVATLARMSSTPVKTFTIGFDDAQADELEYARLVAKQFGTDHTEAILRPDLVSISGELVRYFGEPFADSSAVPTWLVSKVARQKVTVALSGDGGDELFAGYTWLHMNRRVQSYRTIPSPFRRAIHGALRCLPSTSLVAKLRRFNQDSFLDARDSFRRRQTCFNSAMRCALYAPDFVERLDKKASDRFEEHATAGPALLDEWMLYQDTVMYLPDDILTKVDRMSMAHSLEARVPLLDHRLVEFAATVPFELKYGNGISKRLVKHALRDVLPGEVLQQRKRGFSIPIQRWFREGLRDYFRETALGSQARSREYLDPATITELFAAHTARRDDYGHHLWAILVFEHWLRYTETLPGGVG